MSSSSSGFARGALLLVAGALATSGAARAEEPAPAGGGALRVTADPPRLVLGRRDAAELRISAPPEIEELSITASLGRVEGIRRLPGGGFVARYRPPPERLPQVAIVAAAAHTAHGLQDGWIAIPLSGEGDARVPGVPGSEVILRIGDRAFGPTKVGSDGIAKVPVIVPPGVREAHQGFRPIDLRVPETPLLHAIQDRARIRADREEQVRVVAYVVAPHGAARRGELPVFEPSRGSVAVSEREPGAFHAVWSLPPGLAGEERLSIRVPAAPVSRAVLRVESTPGPPAVVAVSFDRDALVAGGEAAIVTARALDAGGNPVPAQLSLSARGALLSGVDERRPGAIVARIAAGETVRGREAIVVASAPKAGITGSRALPLVGSETPGLMVSARAGLAADVRGRFTGGSAGVAVERPSDISAAVRRGADLAWRIEVEGMQARTATLAAILAGAGVRRDVGGPALLEVSASGGALLVPGGATAAGRLALNLGLRRNWGFLFVEGSLLGAGAGAPGPFAAMGLSAGVRFDVETSDGNHPHRR